MRQRKDYSDSRLSGACVYCGGAPATKDHVVSKVLLDDPFPENLPKVDACDACNQSFSRHEEYLACLVEAVITGSSSPTPRMRPKVQRILTKRPSLVARIESSLVERGDSLIWEPERERVEIVIGKLAQGHAAFDLAELDLGLPGRLMIAPLGTLDEASRHQFEQGAVGEFWPEVGSRAMQRMAESWPNLTANWVIVQPERYRYKFASGPGTTVRIVLSEYLACEVQWN